MKGIKKTLSVIITIVLVLSAMPLGTVSHAATSNNWHWPVDTPWHTSCVWHSESPPPYNSGGPHWGTDFAGNGVYEGANVYSTCDGEVVRVANHSSYGNYVKIKAIVNGNAVYILYAHLQEFATYIGAKVVAGQVIGKAGHTGSATGTHLHYEVDPGADFAANTWQTLNPSDYLPGTSYTFETNYSSPPSAPSVTIDKTDLAVNEKTTLHWNLCNNAQYYWISCWSDTAQVISEESHSYTKTVSFSKPGIYSITVVSGNPLGEVIGNWIQIKVYDKAPAATKVSIDKTTLAVNEKTTLRWNTVESISYYWISCWSSKAQVISEESHSSSKIVSFAEPGNYQITVVTCNPIGETIGNWVNVCVVDAKTVSFNPNGGICSTLSKSITYNSTYGSLPVPTRAGYTFIGWYTATSGGKAVTEDTTVTTTSDHTLYAHWRPNVLIIHYDCFGSYPYIDSSKGFYFGDYNRICTTLSTQPHHTAWDTENVYYETLEYGQTLDASGLHDYADFGLTAPSGYGFYGWRSGDNGKLLDETTQYAATDLTDEILEGDCDVWLSAKHTLAQYTVSFDANGGFCGLIDRTATYSLAYGALPTATRDGYMFLGWFTAREGGQKITDDTIMTRTNNHTLYAHYEKVFILGDADGDGDIGLKDVVQITRYLAGGWDVTVDLAAADVNHDGEVNLKDAVILRRYLVGGWNVELK